VQADLAEIYGAEVSHQMIPTIADAVLDGMQNGKTLPWPCRAAHEP